MKALLLLGVLGCSESGESATPTDSQPEVEEEVCTSDEFCDAFMTCFGFMGEDQCHDYYADGLGFCADADDETLEEFHLCLCGCWTSEDDRTCMGMGSCSDWCTTTVCSIF